MSKLIVGAALSALSVACTIGYVGQVVEAGRPYADLQGPVFGTRVGVYHTDDLTVPLQEDQQSGQHKVVLYRLPSGAIEHCEGDPDPDVSLIGTAPKAVKSSMMKRLALPKSLIAPEFAPGLEPIPEGEATHQILPGEDEVPDLDALLSTTRKILLMWMVTLCLLHSN